MIEKWIIFKDRITGREFLSYKLLESTDEQDQETRERLAKENGIPVEQIRTVVKNRRSKSYSK